jgi:hypothetical protein
VAAAAGVSVSDWGPYASEHDAVEGSWLMVRAMRPTWTPSAALVATAIGYAESRFGVTPDWQLPDGSPSFNWGATVGAGDRGSLEHADHDKNGKPVVYKFRAYWTPNDGFDFWARNWPAVDAAQSGDARAVSRRMYEAHWFTGTKGSDADRVEAYAKVIDGAARHVQALLGPLAMGASVTLAAPSSSPATTTFGGLGVLLLLLLLSRR